MCHSSIYSPSHSFPLCLRWHPICSPRPTMSWASSMLLIMSSPLELLLLSTFPPPCILADLLSVYPTAISFLLAFTQADAGCSYPADYFSSFRSQLKCCPQREIYKTIRRRQAPCYLFFLSWSLTSVHLCTHLLFHSPPDGKLPNGEDPAYSDCQ